MQTKDIKVKEVGIPTEGQYTLDNFGNLVVYKDGKWIDTSKLTVSSSAFYNFGKIWLI